MTDADYIADRVEADPNSGCWIWSLAHFSNGYGAVSNRGERLAHRMSYRAFIGPIPDGTLVCHRCDTPSCVNPGHLFIGSQSDNMMDMVKKGRHGLKNDPSKSSWSGNRLPRLAGSSAPRAKMNDVQIGDIRHRAKNGARAIDMAREYGVSDETMRRIIRGQTYTAILNDGEGE